MAINYPHIEEREGTYYVQGRRVPIISLIYLWNNGADAESIQRSFPAVTLADVYGAVAFYLDHREMMDAHFKQYRAEEEAILAALDQQNASFRAELQRRYAAMQAQKEASAS
jgi:uncharacterized protein (DUF433 family)